jgi:hypothetical protein
LLNDLNLEGNLSQEISITTSNGDIETLVLSEANMPGGIYSGMIHTESGEPNEQDGILQLLHGVSIYATYYDLDDGSGNPATVTEKAIADCKAPTILNVQIYSPGPEPIVTFDTNEPTNALVLVQAVCCPNDSFVRRDFELTRHHTITLGGVSANTEYIFSVEAVDVVGNTTTDNNEGSGYPFITTGPGDMFVPHDYATIQHSIDEAWDTSTIWVADGVYTGDGNVDIDFKGRAITLRSTKGPDNCIIDCNGDANNPHYAFHFHNEEDNSSVVSGFTVINGYSIDGYFGGAVTCYQSSPIINDCHFLNCYAKSGGAIACKFSSPTINGCTMVSKGLRSVGQ